MIGRLEYDGPLADAGALGRRLVETGLSPAGARTKAELFARAADKLGGEPVAAFFVPGRIEVLGKHTDYAGGSSLLAAAERGICLAVRPREDPTVAIADVAWGESVRFDLDVELVPRAGHWSNYPMTAARRVARNFHQARRGADVAWASDLPPAAGMSSSSTLVVATFLALAEVNGLWDCDEFRENITEPTDLAGYLGTIENGQTFGTLEGDRGVGTFGGSEDHTAMLCCRPRQLSQYAYCPVRFERRIALPEGYTFAIATSGIAAEKTGAAMERYNTASRLAREIAQMWRDETGGDEPHLAAIVAGGPEAVERLERIVRRQGSMVDDMRLEHFLVENQSVLPAAGDALAAGDLETFGRLVDRSQEAAETLLCNQIDETKELAASARVYGAAAASAFGAGFGGSVWALVETARAEEFLESWSEHYRGHFPANVEASMFFTTPPGPAAFQLAQSSRHTPCDGARSHGV